MFCDRCKLKAFSGNSIVCGYFLHGGETIYINEYVAKWCPKTKNNQEIQQTAKSAVDDLNIGLDTPTASAPIKCSRG